MDQELRDLLLARKLVQSGQARSVREAVGAPRKYVAASAGVTLGAIRLWENGARRPSGAKGVAYGAVLRQLLEVS